MSDRGWHILTAVVVIALFGWIYQQMALKKHAPQQAQQQARPTTLRQAPSSDRHQRLMRWFNKQHQ
jgi:hypothetical protein